MVVMYDIQKKYAIGETVKKAGNTTKKKEGPGIFRARREPTRRARCCII